MSEMIKINIDGRDIEVEKGVSVLTAARKANIDIPTLCFLKEINALSTAGPSQSQYTYPQSGNLPQCICTSNDGSSRRQHIVHQ